MDGIHGGYGSANIRRLSVGKDDRYLIGVWSRRREDLRPHYIQPIGRVCDLTLDVSKISDCLHQGLLIRVAVQVP